MPAGAHNLHGEIFAPGYEGSGAALALALVLDLLHAPAPVEEEVQTTPAQDQPGTVRAPASHEAVEQRQVLWVQDRAAIRLTGRPYRPGLPAMLRRRLIHVAAETPQDALFALEEGVRCRDLACVIGEIAGNPRALDFTASRRLSLAAERHGVPLFLVRLDAATDLSSARMRWRVRAAPSPPPAWNAAAPGPASWHAELFRARAHPPGSWILREAGGVLSIAPSAHPEERWGEPLPGAPPKGPATQPGRGAAGSRTAGRRASAGAGSPSGRAS